MATASQIATPPSIAVGFLCQRSVFGTATKPKRRATARTSGVSISAKQKEAATARRVRGLKGITIQAKALLVFLRLILNDSFEYPVQAHLGTKTHEVANLRD